MKTAMLKEGIDYRVAGRLFVKGVPQFVDDELGTYLAGVPQFDVSESKTSPKRAKKGSLRDETERGGQAEQIMSEVESPAGEGELGEASQAVAKAQEPELEPGRLAEIIQQAEEPEQPAAVQGADDPETSSARPQQPENRDSQTVAEEPLAAQDCEQPAAAQPSKKRKR